MPAATLVPTRVNSFIDRQKAAMIVGWVDIEGDDSYAAGGWGLTKAGVNPNLTTLYHYHIDPVEGYQLIWEHALGKLTVWELATGHTHEMNAADGLEDVTFRLYYEGI